MKKIANFIIDKRYIVMAVVVLIMIICASFMQKVEVNSDLTKYLNDDSSMKIGLDLIEDEFPDTVISQTIRVMFQDLDSAQKADVLSQLENITYVDSVEYDADSEDYNRDNHTLYILTTTYAYGSDEELSIEAALEKNFEQYDMLYKNDNTALGDFPMWIIGMALVLLLIILLIMCNSWVEPFLFLAAIGVAVVINMGTNIVMGSISNITFSIAAILQLSLSMDYSVILMNRYRQEKQSIENKQDAMKAALVHAFSSITSSSVTTIVGLLALVFMSFKIGVDLGVVLAKGVLISMFCIFTLLPGMILACDKLIQKTTKKVLHISMNKAAQFCYRFRYMLSIAFVVLFVGVYILQGNTEMVYTLDREDPIADVFPSTNMVVMLYENQDEDKIAEIAEQLEQDPNMKLVMGYPNIFGKEYTAAELVDTMGKMDSDMELDASLLNILYYDYYTDGKLSPMTASEFLRFISGDILENEALSDNIDNDIRENMDMIKEFSNAEDLTREMGAAELADFFDMDIDDIKQIFLYYYVQNGGGQTESMTLSAFTDFVVNEVASNDTYAAMMNSDALAQMELLTDFADANKMTTRYSYQEIADLLGMDQNTVKLLFVYYYALSDNYTPESMTFPVFAQFISNDVAANPMFASYFDAASLAQMNVLAQYTNKEVFQRQMTSAELAGMLNMEEALVQQIFLLGFGQNAGEATMSLEQMVGLLLSNPVLTANFDETTLQQLTFMQMVMKSSEAGTAYPYTQMAQLLNMDPGAVKMLYTYYTASYGNISAWKLSVQTVVDFLVSNSGQFSSMIGSSDLAQLKMVQKLINASMAGTSYSAEELANLLGTNAAQMHPLYLLYTSEHGDTTEWKLSVENLVHFIVSDVLTNNGFSNDADSREMLIVAEKLIDAVVSGNTYTAEEMTELLSGISDQLDNGMMELLYLYYASTEESDPAWTLTIEELFNHLTEDILNDTRFADIIDADMRADVEELKKQIDDGISQLKGSQYSLLILSSTYPEEAPETTAFFDDLTSLCNSQLEGNYYLVGNSAMNYEMQQSFGKELLFITLLTSIAIFIVVALTFRSIIIPLILVLIVQCGVYITVSVIGLQGYSIYYLALIIVECILMGATIDYGILFTNYYREKRREYEVKAALKEAYDSSIHTILTSGLILVLVTGIIGYTVSDPAIGQICRTISIGALSATLLILFVLPSLLATFDKIITRKGNK